MKTLTLHPYELTQLAPGRSIRVRGPRLHPDGELFVNVATLLHHLSALEVHRLQLYEVFHPGHFASLRRTTA